MSIASAVDNSASESTPRAARYRAAWRWHFYAGLFVAPVLVILAITGAIYLFDRELDAWWNADVHTIAPGVERAPLAIQEQAVRAAYPSAKVGRVRLPHSAAESSMWSIDAQDGRHLNVYVDPYRAQVIGERDADWQPLTIVRDLHGNLLAGDWGSYIVELVACWTLIMLITGVYLWWPRKWRVSGVFGIRTQERGRALWRDLHAVPSIFNALLVGLLVLTGLPWSVFWGVQFAKLGEVVPFVAASPNFKAPPTIDSAAADPHAQHKTTLTQLPWTIQQLDVPTTSGPRIIGIAEIEPLLSRLPQETFGPGVRIIYPSAPNGVFTISYVPDKAQGQQTIYIDPANGAVMNDIAWRHYSPIAKAVEWGVETHVGRQYGLANQLVNLLVCVVLIGTTLAGVYMWWTRRPKGALAAPPKKNQDRLPRPLFITMIVCAILFPLMGASLLIVVLLEQSFAMWRRANVG